MSNAIGSAQRLVADVLVDDAYFHSQLLQCSNHFSLEYFSAVDLRQRNVAVFITLNIFQFRKVCRGHLLDDAFCDKDQTVRLAKRLALRTVVTRMSVTSWRRTGWFFHSSGMRVSVAPTLFPIPSARCPALRPMLTTRNQRWPVRASSARFRTIRVPGPWRFQIRMS